MPHELSNNTQVEADDLSFDLPPETAPDDFRISSRVETIDQLDTDFNHQPESDDVQVADDTILTPPVGDSPPREPNQRDAANFGPAAAELIATRAELKRIENQLAEQIEAGKEAREQTLRLQADFDNFRRRAERARGETYTQLVADVVAELLPVIDNLQRALDTSRGKDGDASPEFQQFAHGIELINKQLTDVVQSYGVERIEAVGLRFNPELHEAIAVEASDEYESETVIAEIVRGYRLGDKLLRPAMVKVAQ